MAADAPNTAAARARCERLEVYARTLIVAAALLVAPFVASGEVAQAQLRGTDSTRAALCNGTQPAFADFDQNGIADRVDASHASGRAAVLLTLNGLQRIVLADASEACRLLVLDIDHDADTDLVALTTTGHLLLWRNHGGALSRVQPQQESDVADAATSLVEHARAADSIVVNRRDLPGTVPAAQLFARPGRISRIVDIAGRHRATDTSRLAARAPPIC